MFHIKLKNVLYQKHFYNYQSSLASKPLENENTGILAKIALTAKFQTGTEAKEYAN
jgi:hypothetical protein